MSEKFLINFNEAADLAVVVMLFTPNKDTSSLPSPYAGK